jgi:hypothetical protein
MENFPGAADGVAEGRVDYIARWLGTPCDAVTWRLTAAGSGTDRRR